ncbi:MAG: hypothetical protein JWN70_3315 [Planctomycetaceae bacterium]|nr:hypothetical protein [Planctomycetaceae bacterium]
MSSVPFDPYHKWLGIPHREQPAHHYRLLGIPLYEDDPQVVEAAADRQMAFLRKFQTGEHAADALKLLNEISRARICLLKPDAKAAYDETLRAELNEPEPAAPIEIDTSATLAATPLWKSPAVLGGAGVAVVATIVVALLILSPKSKPQPVGTDVVASGNPEVPKVEPAKPVENTPPTVANGSDSASNPKTAKTLPNQDRPLAKGDKAPWPTLVGSDPEARTKPGKTEPTAGSKKAVDPRTAPRTKPSSAVNLLSRINVDRNRIAGEWSSANDQLISPLEGMTRLGVPYVMPDLYDLTFTVERASGTRGFCLVFPVQGQPAQLLIDGQNATQTKLANGLGGKKTDEPVIEGQLLFPDRPVEFVLQVRRGRISVAADGKEILNWKGDASYFQPSLNENFSNPKARELMLVSLASAFRVSKLEVSPPPRATETETAKDAVDLLSYIKIDRSSPQGDWTFKDGMLTGHSARPNQPVTIEVPYEPPAGEYDLDISLTREEVQGACLVGLQVQGHQCYLQYLTDGQYDLFGITEIDGHTGAQNETTKSMPAAAKGLPTLAKCRVRQQSITVDINGEKIIDWKCDPTRLSTKYVTFPNPKTLVLAVQGTTIRFNRFTFTPVGDGAAKNALTAESEASKGMAADPVLQIKKHATPDAVAQDAARKAVREGLKVEYALAKKADSKHLDAKVTLAKSLLAQAENADDDPAKCYVMLYDAAELAADSGQLSLAWEILVALGDRFDLPSLPLMERAAKAATRFVKNDEDVAYLASMYVLLLDEAVRLDDYETAAKAAPAAANATRKFTVLKEQLAAYARRVNTLREAYELAKPAREVLKVNPNDETANLAWARYICFYKGDWLTGLPMLAKSSNAALASLAKRELEQSRELPVLTQLGDDWWEVAEQEKDPVKSAIRERAADAWQLALPLANGLQKQTLESKVERIFKPTKFFETTGKGQGVSIANPDLNPGPLFTIEFWVATQANSGILISKREDRRDSSIVVALERGRPSISSRSASGTKSGRSRQTINDGRWHHVAAVKIGNRLGLFIDGKWAAQTDLNDNLLSGSPWKVGHDGQTKLDEPEAKFCRFRFSKEARYLVSFHPEKNYSKDKGTLFVP